MPALLPTVDDLQRMTPKQREKAAKAVRAVMDATDRFIDEAMEGRALTPEQRMEARRAVWSVIMVAEREMPDAVGRRIRNHAEALERTLATEPSWVTAARRQALLEAVL